MRLPPALRHRHPLATCRCEVHDVASKNGTVLNGKKITGPTKLQPGDQITLCTRKLTFVAEYSTPQSASKADPG